ncbi:MAG TPA: calcium/sodium antiporter [Anaerolineae bacterium]|nr:calcium/sodium antiporter [Anaerolineae bacterium]
MGIVTLILFLMGLVLLLCGAEVLVRGASALAAAIGISPLVIGLTVVAFGTSSPELAVTIQSGLSGQADIALGNVVGSNICNILLILGLAALLSPLVVSQQLIWLDVPLMIGLSFLVLFLGLDGKFGRLEGAFLFTGLIIYTIWSIYQSRKESKQVKQEYVEEFAEDRTQTKRQLALHAAQVIIGLAMLTIGSNWLVDGAIVMARALGVSELIIGLTIIAIGTSLPEVAATVVASLRGHGDIAVGNVVGSSIFNILSVLGIASLVAPGGVTVPEEALYFDIPVMIAASIACLPIFFIGHQISRWEGGLFFGYYVAYILYLILYASQHTALPAFSLVMRTFVIPLTAVTVMILFVRAIRAHHRNLPKKVA